MPRSKSPTKQISIDAIDAIDIARGRIRRVSAFMLYALEPGTPDDAVHEHTIEGMYDLVEYIHDQARAMDEAIEAERDEAPGERP